MVFIIGGNDEMFEYFFSLPVPGYVFPRQQDVQLCTEGPSKYVSACSCDGAIEPELKLT